MTQAAPTTLEEARAAFTRERSYDLLSGDDEHGYNACIEMCDRHAGNGHLALRSVAIDGGVETVTFDALRVKAAQFADLLIARGAQPGDCVAGLLPRRPELLTVLLGTLRAGCVYQPLFTAFGPKAIEGRLRAGTPRLIVTDRANRSKLDGLDPAPVLVIDEPTGDESFEAAMQGRSETRAPVMLPGDAPFLMMFTSGTTGPPKRLLVPIHMLRGAAVYLRDAVGLRDDDRFWNIADPGWAYGLYYALCGPLFLGMATTLSEAPFSVERCYDVIRSLGVTNLAGSPTAFRSMAASPHVPPAGLRAISSAGEPLDVGTCDWLKAHFGCTARDHWGQTEMGMVICDHHALEHPRRPGSIGYPLPGWRATTLTHDGREQGVGEEGMLAIDRRSPLFWFAGYEDQADQPFLGDYYLTGDNAVRDADGAFSFVGRDDDVITSSGYRIGPSEVESALLEHPAVAEAAVIGRPDPVRTEVVKAFVTLLPGTEGCDELADDIRRFVKQRLAAHAYPREISFVAELPKTPSGKIQRSLLRQRETAQSQGIAN